MPFLRPTKSPRIIQYFGQNLVNFYAQLGLKGHNGVDLEAPTSEPVYFNWIKNYGEISIGEVVNVSDSWTKGLGVTILIKDEDGYFKLVFWHFKSYCVKIGDTVKTGQLLGYADNSGMSTGSHLHFGEYYSNVYGNTLQSNNGFGGALDPMPKYIDIYVIDYVNMLKKKVGIMQQLLNKMIELYNIIKK